MLSRQEYLGHTVNFKTYRKSYKQKKQLKTDPSEWQIFENTHEAIIDQDTFDIVQRIRDGRRRWTPMGEMPILSGMLFCADCGAKLYQVRGRGWEHDKEYFVCATYRKVKGGCSSHQIRNVVVEELLLDGIRQITAFARAHEDEFVHW
jgi:site-specific DNA recombinase